MIEDFPTFNGMLLEQLDLLSRASEAVFTTSPFTSAAGVCGYHFHLNTIALCRWLLAQVGVVPASQHTLNRNLTSHLLHYHYGFFVSLL